MHYEQFYVKYKGLNREYINYHFMSFSDLELSFWFELRTDSSRRGPFLFFFDYFKSIQDRITYCTSFERLYFSLSNDINNNIVICDFQKIC